jgi:hypothetical protein
MNPHTAAATDVFDVHPRPWKLGESKTSRTAILDANNVFVADVSHGCILLGHRETPQRIIDAINGGGK